MRTDLPKVNLGNITLRELCEADYFDYFFIGSNPEVVKYLNWGPLLSMNDSIWVFNEVFLISFLIRVSGSTRIRYVTAAIINMYI